MLPMIERGERSAINILPTPTEPIPQLRLVSTLDTAPCKFRIPVRVRDMNLIRTDADDGTVHFMESFLFEEPFPLIGVEVEVSLVEVCDGCGLGTWDVRYGGEVEKV